MEVGWNFWSVKTAQQPTASFASAGAPMEVSQDLITTFNIGLVTHGTISETSKESPTDPQRYAVPKEMGIFR